MKNICSLPSQVYLIPGIRQTSYFEHDIIHDVFEYLDIPIANADSKLRTFVVSEARQISMYFIKSKFPNITLSRIGSFFKRDHATVVYSIRLIKNTISYSPVFREKINAIDAIITKKMEAAIKARQVEKKS